VIYHLNIKARHLNCPICKGSMSRSEDNIENWECKSCKIVIYMKIVGSC
jgi:transposase-like protein